MDPSEKQKIIDWLEHLAKLQWDLYETSRWPSQRERHRGMAQGFESAKRGIEREDYLLPRPEDG